MRGILTKLVAVGAVSVLSASAPAVIVYNDSDGNTAAPSGDRGWSTVGRFNSASGVAIAPNHFIATVHQGAGSVFHLNGTDYTVVGGGQPVPGNSDLAIFTTAQTLPTFAPLYTGSVTNQPVTLVGYGIHTLGTAVTTTDPIPNNHGWRWGSTKAKSWGLNEIDNVLVSGGTSYLQLDFDSSTDQGTYGDKDSGGGVFINDGGVWKLAGINYGVEAIYNFTPSNTGAFNAAIYAGPDSTVSSELFLRFGTNNWVPAPRGPQWLYAHDLTAVSGAIATIVPEPAALSLVALAGVLMIRRRHAA